MDTPSLQTGDDAAAAVQKTPNRVTLDSMKARISRVEYHSPNVCQHMTVCFVEIDNGFILVGKAAPADAENFDRELGMKFALEDALRQMWPLEAYLLRERLSA